MTTLKLAANFIVGLPEDVNLWHLQIVHGNDEIEVQSPFGESEYWHELGFFAYPEIQDHSDTNYFGDPTKYGSISLNTDGRDPDKVWELLSRIHAQFVLDSPNFEYGTSYD